MEYKETNVIRQNQSFWNNAIEASIIALIILVPLVFYPYLTRIFNPAKELVFEFLVIIGLMFWAIKMVSQEKIKFIHSPLDFSVIAFMAICTLSLLWSDSPYITLKELPLFLAGPLLYFVVNNNIINHKQRINRIINVLLFVGTLFGIYGILQYNGIDFSFWIKNLGRQKVFGLFGNVNYFAEYLIIPLPIAIALFFANKNKTSKILLSISILAMGGSLIATFTRGTYLGLGISLVFMFILFLTIRSKNFVKEHKKAFIFILALIILVTFLFVLPNPLNKSGTVISKIKGRISIAQLTKGSSLKRRIAIWKFTGMIIEDHPLLGSGLGTFKYNSLNYQAKFFNRGENRSLYPYGIADKVHNEYLQFWAELGIIGLGAFMWIIISFFICGVKLLKKTKDNYKEGLIIGLMGGIIAVLVEGLFGFPLHQPATIVLFWLSLALIGVGEGSEGERIKNRKQKQSDIGKNDTSIYRFKPLLYLIIILLSISAFIGIIRPFVAQTYWYKGFKEIEKENWDKAIKIYEEALRWDPYLGPIYYDIGKILQDKELYGISREYLEKAAKYIDHPDLPLDLAIIYLKSGMLDEAAIKLKQAISYQPDEKSMLPLYAELGNTYLQLERYKPAEIVLKDALIINPNFINAHYGLAGAYLNQNKLDEALVELQKVIELAPDSQEANYAQNIIQQITQEKLKVSPTKPDN
jgi:tetratricopeptide (TPR) repeat protein